MDNAFEFRELKIYPARFRVWFFIRNNFGIRRIIKSERTHTVECDIIFFREIYSVITSGLWSVTFIIAAARADQNKEARSKSQEEKVLLPHLLKRKIISR